MKKFSKCEIQEIQHLIHTSIIHKSTCTKQTANLYNGICLSFSIDRYFRCSDSNSDVGNWWELKYGEFVTCQFKFSFVVCRKIQQPPTFLTRSITENEVVMYCKGLTVNLASALSSLNEVHSQRVKESTVLTQLKTGEKSGGGGGPHFTLLG